MFYLKNGNVHIGWSRIIWSDACAHDIRQYLYFFRLFQFTSFVILACYNSTITWTNQWILFIVIYSTQQDAPIQKRSYWHEHKAIKSGQKPTGWEPENMKNSAHFRCLSNVFFSFILLCIITLQLAERCIMCTRWYVMQCSHLFSLFDH